MKRALLFAPYFLPRRRVGAMRPFRFAIHLRAFGWEPTVLTLATPGQHLTEKEAQLLDGIEVVELRAPFDRTARAESQLGLTKARPAKRPGLGASVLETLERQVPADTWLPLFRLRYGEILQTLQRVRPDVLWTTGDPFSGLVVSEKLVRRTGVPWVADFRDPWTLCRVRSAGLWAPTQAINRRLERRILETADAVVFTAQQTEARYRRHYADLAPRTATIYNSFDPVVFDDPVAAHAATPHTATPHAVSPGEGLTLGFFGRFRALSSAALIVDVLARVRQHDPALAERIKVRSFGPLNAEDARYAEARGVRSSFVPHEAVPLERALSALRQFDLLLLSTEARRDEIVPAKLWEYIPSGRPILSLAPNPEVGAILERTGTGVQFDLAQPERVAALLIACLRAKQEGQPLPVPFDPRPEAIRRFDSRTTTGQLASLFGEIAHASG